jgi:hypothetical protein
MRSGGEGGNGGEPGFTLSVTAAACAADGCGGAWLSALCSSHTPEHRAATVTDAMAASPTVPGVPTFFT